jgi:O-antigen ligase
LALVAFAAIAIPIGLQIGDYHVIGLMGGWHGFLDKPFGRGLGIGGNLSEGYFSIDWSAAQQAGTIDGAVESAIGVLLYQMGIAALVPLGFYFAMALKAWRSYASSGNLTQGLAGFGVMVVLLNGMFQEEALFAPPALGLVLSLTGLVIGSRIRMETILQQDPQSEPFTRYQPAT